LAAFGEFKRKVKARVLLGTVGNHDVDSRLRFSEFDPKGHLQALSPPFPGVNGVADRYWARNFHIQEEVPWQKMIDDVHNSAVNW
jgi:hypothetical protein